MTHLYRQQFTEWNFFILFKKINRNKKKTHLLVDHRLCWIILQVWTDPHYII